MESSRNRDSHLKDITKFLLIFQPLLFFSFLLRFRLQTSQIPPLNPIYSHILLNTVRATNSTKKNYNATRKSAHGPLQPARIPNRR